MSPVSNVVTLVSSTIVTGVAATCSHNVYYLTPVSCIRPLIQFAQYVAINNTNLSMLTSSVSTNHMTPMSSTIIATDVAAIVNAYYLTPVSCRLSAHVTRVKSRDMGVTTFDTGDMYSTIVTGVAASHNVYYLTPVSCNTQHYGHGSMALTRSLR